ncbi:MAG: Na+/H+ antiporter [Betaproteobacteria bacterium]|nr:Na+/H+ antiporter [Betaproteobacteria bacterium]
MPWGDGDAALVPRVAMNSALWFLLVGALLVLMALAGSVVRRLPMSMDMLYLFIGVALGPAGLALIQLDPVKDAGALEIATEAVVLFSLFSAGLKLRAAARDTRWRLPLRLGLGVTALTVAGVALAGYFLLDLPPGMAILTGAILAPTDPVLASSVQVENAGDRDRVRFGLTGDAGLNDGAAFPFVMLGLGLMGLHELGGNGLRWVSFDFLWGIGAGLGCGWALGKLVGEVVLYLRREHQEAVGLDEFLSLGLVAISYGAALYIHAYGFLAVFAAGLALRRIEHVSSGAQAPDAVMGANRHGSEEMATHPQKAPVYMAQAMLSFNEQMERIAEVGIVLQVGAMLSWQRISLAAILMTALLFLFIRPLAVRLMLQGSDASRLHKRMMAWFGIRGIGSVYYLVYAVNHGLPAQPAQLAADLVLTVVSASIVLHGISAVPLMRVYGRVQSRRLARVSPAGDRRS